MAAPTPKKFDRSIVEGPVSSAVWKLAWPTVLQNVIGGLQGIVDHAMVGHYVGYAGNAAVGVSLQIFIVVIVFVMSLYTGMGVLVARHAGADKSELVNHAVYQAFVATMLLALFVLAPIGWFATPWLLDLVRAAPAVQAEALLYLRIMLVGNIGMMTFFLLGGALRAAGDAQTPMRLGVAMTVMNVLLNIILIRGLGPIPAFGVAGAAIGTMIAGVTVSAIGLWMLMTGRLVVQFPPREQRRIDWGTIRQLFRFGLPAGLQGIAMNVAGVLLLRFIGSLPQSAEAQAAYAVGYTELFSLITWTSVGLMGAAAAVAGQNLGAGKPERSAVAVRVAAGYGVGIAVVVGTLFLTMPNVLLGLFGMNDPSVLALGSELLRWLAVSGLFISVALTVTGGLQGTGDTKGPLYISIVSQIIVPLGLLTTLQGLRPLSASDIWLAILCGHITRCALSVWRFRRGAWRSISITPAG
ncbi:MAG: MATE family efflux transporter [Gemmatimonadaceae bacterium]|nr:MATE family efflux transporter [Gemmatimonadaceae bacterium]MCW5827062.1 MATE family efflux transporter [Gemmatimonadaceae bacterium]